MPFISPEEAQQKTFDFIIVGGGSTGLTLAARLSEDPARSCLVVEAGQSHLADQKIHLPGQYGVDADNSKCWDFMAEKQEGVANRSLSWYRGKGLGGSSNVNYYVWSKPPAADANATERLGNPGWNWDDFERYSKKTETFHPPTEEQLSGYPDLTFDPRARGTSGPIQVTYPIQEYTIDKVLRDTMLKIPGIKLVPDPNAGDVTGTWTCSASIDPRTWTRSTATSGYLEPSLARENLSILTDALVSRVMFKDALTRGGDVVATGVEIIHHERTLAISGAQIILSAGTVKSPQILELSGIGNQQILADLGIETKVDLPGVGENVQDHTVVRVLYQLRNNTPYKTFDLLNHAVQSEKALALHAVGEGILRMGPTSFTHLPLSSICPGDAPDIIKRAENEIISLEKGSKLLPGLREQFNIQLETLRSSELPDLHVVPFPGVYPASDLYNAPSNKRYVTMLAEVDHPFSRGNIHAASNDYRQFPRIEPNFLAMQIDQELTLQQIKFMKRLAEIEPFKSAIEREVTPGPACASDDDIKNYIKETVAPGWHAIGSCSMLPRDKNGVVDPTLKVYGTSNLRVADMSIVPLQVASHPQSIAYAIGEKAADIIKSIYN